VPLVSTTIVLDQYIDVDSDGAVFVGNNKRTWYTIRNTNRWILCILFAQVSRHRPASLARHTKFHDGAMISLVELMPARQNSLAMDSRLLLLFFKNIRLTLVVVVCGL
jgi:hypothetical protein